MRRELTILPMTARPVPRRAAPVDTREVIGVSEWPRWKLFYIPRTGEVLEVPPVVEEEGTFIFGDVIMEDAACTSPLVIDEAASLEVIGLLEVI